ncbi:MAG: hypothetical protein WC645_01030 [Candidatus Margulisiibacteriota bacterium]
MGKPLISQFQKRFSGRMSVVYAERQGSLAEQKMQKEALAKAVTQVIAGILQREPTQEELLGLVDLSVSALRR